MIIDFNTILFVAIILMLYWTIRPEWRKGLLLLANFTYIGILDLYTLIFVCASGIVSFGISKLIMHLKKQHNRACRFVYYFSLILICSSFFIFKIGRNPFFSSLIQSINVLKILIPLGFSFYILNIYAYISDVYNSKIDAETNLMNYLLYISWFPKFISGPIEKEKEFSDMTNQMAHQRFSIDVFNTATLLIIYGVFLKIVVADRLGIYVNDIFDNRSQYGCISLILGVLFYSFQIYCDFYGYTLFARGVSKLFGIELNVNFKTPYMTTNINEFWDSWHISLSSWLKEYIYIPLGGNKYGVCRKYINIFIVFIVSGIWHGTTLTFLLWGILHSIFTLINDILIRRGYTFTTKGNWGRIICFLEVSFAWIFFRAENVRTAFEYIRCIFVNGIRKEFFLSHFSVHWRQFIDPVLACVFIAIVVYCDRISDKCKIELPMIVKNKGLLFSTIFIYIMLLITLIFGIYGASIYEKTFIYMNF